MRLHCIDWTGTWSGRETQARAGRQGSTCVARPVLCEPWAALSVTLAGPAACLPAVNCHEGQDQSRRDDLWGWLYCLVELLDGEWMLSEGEMDSGSELCWKGQPLLRLHVTLDV